MAGFTSDLINRTCLGLSVMITCYSCQMKQADKDQPLNVTKEFSDYWFQGQAELTSYKLEQARYGEVHPGSAVLIFVTEDFSGQKQVKLDNPQQAGTDAVKVLKLNATRKFNTGVYPYSMMASVFTPLNYEPSSTLKITASSQEWCGHTFSQLNNRGNGFQMSLKSYFESEGDKELSLDKSLLEDELWTNIRLNPDKLPTGDIEILPSALYLRLSHRPVKAEKAEAKIVDADSVKTYSLSYIEFDRSLKIMFNADFPYDIISWEENYTSGFGANAKKLTTRAARDKTIMLDYWGRNSLADSVWRDKLNLQ